MLEVLWNAGREVEGMGWTAGCGVYRVSEHGGNMVVREREVPRMAWISEHEECIHRSVGHIYHISSSHLPTGMKLKL